MKKVVNINLGGLPFTIDEDAYARLEKYLNTIHRHFKGSEGYEEITDDIEARMAELFQDQLGSSKAIVTLKDVEVAIETMGSPEEFGAEADDIDYGASESTTSAGDTPPRLKVGKRLFRNEDEKVVGGVCSGLAAYVGIADPLWVRLAFVAFTLLGFGLTIPIYLILWAIVPAAETAGDRLAMKGEPINVSNIGKIIENEMNDFSDRMNQMSDEWDAFGKKKVPTKTKKMTRKERRTTKPAPMKLEDCLPAGFLS